MVFIVLCEFLLFIVGKKQAQSMDQARSISQRALILTNIYAKLTQELTETCLLTNSLRKS